MSQYPEHEKVKSIQHESQIIHEFVAYLNENDVELCDRIEPKHASGNVLYSPSPIRITDLVADYFGVDLKKFNAEKDAMYEAMRKHNEYPRPRDP